MKQLAWMVMLIASISGNCIAQQPGDKNSDKVFDLPLEFAKRRFIIDLGQGNTLRLDLSEIEDLDYISDLDSILREFANDINLLEDTLQNEMNTRRIDYLLDKSAYKKMRIQEFVPKGSSFSVVDDEVIALKLEQDTINLIGTIYFSPKYTFRKRFNDVRKYRVSFYLNDIKQLNTYLEEGLNAKINALKKSSNPQWTRKSGHVVLANDSTVTARFPNGYVAAGTYLNFRISVDLQNYKKYFVPSLSLGAGLIISSHGFFKREVILSWDPQFLFANNASNELKTYRNDFLTLTYGQGVIRDHEARKESPFLAIFSFGYLIHRDGDFYNEHTMRIGAGRLSLFEGKSKIEPIIYFNDFFKGVTPGLRWIQSF